jgi:hypothetical protein
MDSGVCKSELSVFVSAKNVNTPSIPTIDDVLAVGPFSERTPLWPWEGRFGRDYPP